ncbi:MAG: 4-hydroxy-tetrahydrodipicolinate reductase [Deltaproteobacteria bacterium]|nr:4-hydroxy-tetrahydrodipicolinate reductase [Deltaproteobacteria bacterium]
MPPAPPSSKGRTPIVVCGAAGRMGRAITGLIAAEPQARLAAAVEMPGHPALGQDAGVLAGGAPLGVVLTSDYAAAAQPDTVTLDFTAAPAAIEHLRSAVANQAGIVIGTTGFSADEQRELDQLAPRTRCVVAANMSVGVNVLMQLVERAAQVLGDGFDVEIVEVHHRMKVDAPSGTALALGRSAAAGFGRDFDQVKRLAREGIVGKRTDPEIGIVALRGGDVIGDHTVVFAGMGERLELSHRAQSRDCLARGALRAGLWLAGQPVGRYSMREVLGL